jgi:DNA polymerase III subunit gamma/tau
MLAITKDRGGSAVGLAIDMVVDSPVDCCGLCPEYACMSYLVLARKYRPQKFEDLLGQEHVARTLTNAINMGRVHHAFLFTGARGIGKTSAARILAKALCCAQGPTANPCGTCAICQSISSGQSVDVQEIDGASNTGVDDVRALREGVRYLPAEARKKVYIIDEVHMLSTSAFNALLKTLEEPPEHVVFIFATTEVHKIPATIMSRCQRYDFKLLPSKVLAEHLTRILSNEKIACEPDAVRLVAREAAGSVRDGLSLLDQVVAYVGDETLTREKVAEVLGVADRRLLYQLADKVLARDVAETLRQVADAVDRGVDLMQMARAFLGFLHDIELVGAIPDAQDLIDATAEEAAEIKTLASKAGKGLASSLFDRWARAVEEAARSQTPRLLLEMALVDLCNAEPMLPLGDLLDRLEKLEGRLGGAGAPARPTSSERPRNAPPARQSAMSSPTTSPAAPSLSPHSDIAEVWRRVRESFGHRPAVAAALDHAEVGGWEGGAVSLQFSQKFALDQTARFKAEVERALTQITGTATRVELTMATGKVLPMVRSQVGREAEAAQVDQHQRETEAREHPMIRKAQELFGVAPKEIKTP